MKFMNVLLGTPTTVNEANKSENQNKVLENCDTQIQNGDFILKAGHKGYYDGFAYYIEGEVVNNRNKSYSYAQIEFNVYDENGTQLGSAFDNINNLDANGTWKFKAVEYNGNDENIASYKIVDISAW